MKTELIVSTYNNPRSLRLCLASVAAQRVATDTVCIADDGSGPETAQAIAEFAAAHPQLRIRHVWHEDRGFEKCAILNKAMASSEADYLVFIDGDVMIHPEFIARHLELARRGRFCTGSLIRLDMATTQAVTPEMVRDGTVFDRRWLREHGAIDRFGTWLKTMPLPKPVLEVLDVITPVQKALCGANASLFRDDALAVNGYDEEFKYGGEDKDFGVRLANRGIRGRHLRYTAPLVHLEHARGYADPERIKRHRLKIRERRRSGQYWVEQGIRKGPEAA